VAERHLDPRPLLGDEAVERGPDRVLARSDPDKAVLAPVVRQLNSVTTDQRRRGDGDGNSSVTLPISRPVVVWDHADAAASSMTNVIHPAVAARLVIASPPGLSYLFDLRWARPLSGYDSTILRYLLKYARN
jgi:hypothetical protein